MTTNRTSEAVEELMKDVVIADGSYGIRMTTENRTKLHAIAVKYRRMEAALDFASKTFTAIETRLKDGRIDQSLPLCENGIEWSDEALSFDPLSE